MSHQLSRGPTLCEISYALREITEITFEIIEITPQLKSEITIIGNKNRKITLSLASRKPNTVGIDASDY